MEREFKWKATYENFKEIIKYLDISEIGAVDMTAAYYDTTSKLLRSRKIALRLRNENDCQMCCLKLQDSARDGLHVHDEFECPASSLKDGLAKLPEIGAPKSLCDALRAENLIIVCETRFRRMIALWVSEYFTAEIAFDEGLLICYEKQKPFCEIECELKSGDEDDFEKACIKLSEKFSLKSEPKSKFSRALDLEN